MTGATLDLARARRGGPRRDPGRVLRRAPPDRPARGGRRGGLAARHLAAPVAAGLGRLASALRRAARSRPTFLFLGVAALVSLVGGALLRGTAVARAVRGPADRGVGALLGGAKGALVAWVLAVALLALGAAAARSASRARSARASSWTSRRGTTWWQRVAPDGAKTLERFRTRGEGEPARR